QPRLAELVATRLRDDILTGRLKEGDRLPRQEQLFTDFQVSLPAVREAMRILETDGLISVRRGNVGGAIVHQPNAERTAKTISNGLETRGATINDVSTALLNLEPTCARMCADREDRLTSVVPHLHDAINAQHREFDNITVYNSYCRQFHYAMVSNCGNE